MFFYSVCLFVKILKDLFCFVLKKRKLIFTTHTDAENDPSEFSVYEWTEKLSLHTNTMMFNLPLPPTKKQYKELKRTFISKLLFSFQ